VGRPAARVTDPVVHPAPPVLTPGPGSFNVFIGGLPAWRGIPAAAAAAIQSAKSASDATIQAAEAATAAAAGTPGAPAALAAEQTAKATAAASMGSMITGGAGGADIHVCATPLPVPPHGPGVIVDGSQTVLINGLPACRQGDTIVEAVGPPNKVALGLLTVLIGDSASAGSAAASGAVANSPAGKLAAWRQQKQAVIEKALKNQKDMLENKLKELDKWDAAAKAKFKTAFGKDDDASKQLIKDRIKKMLDVNKSMTFENFKPADPPDPDTFAYVYPTDTSHTVYLDQAFDRAPDIGQDSRAGTLSHEMSHFRDIGGTRDKFKGYNNDHPVYGVTASRKLAKDDPDKALNHADSFEYYLEDAP